MRRRVIAAAGVLAMDAVSEPSNGTDDLHHITAKVKSITLKYMPWLHKDTIPSILPYTFPSWKEHKHEYRGITAAPGTSTQPLCKLLVHVLRLVRLTLARKIHTIEERVYIQTGVRIRLLFDIQHVSQFTEAIRGQTFTTVHYAR